MSMRSSVIDSISLTGKSYHETEQHKIYRPAQLYDSCAEAFYFD